MDGLSRNSSPLVRGTSIESRVIGLTSAVTRFAPKGHDRIAQGEALGPKERKMASPVRARQSECAWLENGSGAPSGLMAD